MTAIAPLSTVIAVPTHDARRRFSRTAALMFALALIAIVAPYLAPYDPNVPLDSINLRSQAPSLQHPFGTDHISRDVLSRVLSGARLTMAFAAGAVALSLCVGTLYGALAAYLGGTAERALMRVLDIAMALPRLLLLLTITALWNRPSIFALVLLIGGTGWFDVARLVRGEVTALLKRDYVAAAKALGVRPARVLLRHALPHLIPTLAVTGTLAVAQTIALESGLDYLGLGLPIPAATFGTILNEGSGVIDTQWWLTLFPGIAIVVAVFACNAFGDALRDRFAPKQLHA